MSAQPTEPLPRRSAVIPRDPASVRAALPAARAAGFQAEWDAALDQARADLDLAALTARLEKITAEYWAIVCALVSPRAVQADQDSRRWQAGGETDVISVEAAFSGLR
ncbi:DUF6247 family protein [Streptomyces sp. AM 4-1-1]|uniref:DUF6247 family protein n=1 Tax=Streptomyces sp. AM 4-1-1 TaxID=3028710 RepID=UPI0023B8FAF1|nr:DUF6247 family protein [Streptomyces sp. AM 4-1-1]WEH37254.1 DUF6247 family protein [Streptomyces sp. AM 4-1-1]